MIVPTYLILNQLVGVVEVHTVKSQGEEDWRAMYLLAVNIGPLVIKVES